MASCEQIPSQHLRRTKPARVVNELYRQGLHMRIAKFYADELSEQGFETERMNRDNFNKLSPEEKKSTASDLYESLKKLARSGKVIPEALYLSSKMWPRQGKSEELTSYLAHLDRPHFDLLLREYFSVSLQQGQQFSSILSLGCGVDLEAQVIRHRLSPGLVKPLHVGLDSDATKIQDASKLNPSAQNYFYITGDANSPAVKETLSSIIGSERQFDLIMARHFPVWKHGDLWQRTLEGYAPRLKTGGMLLMTLYYDPEFEDVISKGLPGSYRVICSERNKARSFNRRMDLITTFGGFIGAMGSDNNSPNNDLYQLWLNNMCRDKFIILAQRT